MKKLDARKYFAFVVPLLLVFRLISYFTIEQMLGNEFTIRAINMVIIIAICFSGLKFAQKKEQ